MAGIRTYTSGVSSGAINGARTAYVAHTSGSQENVSYTKQPTNGPKSASYGSMSRTPLTSTMTNGKQNYDSGHLTPNRNGASDAHGGISRSGSETDSLRDLYGSNRNLSNLDSDIPENMYKPEQVQDPEGWIHRDKLAKIESEELQAAGINLANAKQSMSKAGRRSQSRETDRAGGVEASQRPTREEKQIQRSPPVVEDPEEEKRGWDLRSPEEIAAEQGQRSGIPTPTLKKPSSRIPVLSSSPMPIPQERVERETPLPRKRTLSGTMSLDDGTPVPKVRHQRKNSAGAMLMDDDETGSNLGYRSGSNPSSPNKSKITKPSGPASPTSKTRKVTPAGARKPSTSTTKPGATPRSGTISPTAQRPGTRSGDQDRPRTAVNRPEGDAPWLATMYKSDPSLPPDKQIIPTHARKQQQAQWTEEGSIPSTYDREFHPLAVHTAEGLVKVPSPIGVVEKPNSADQEAWPLKPMPSVRSNNSNNGRPGTSGSMTAGYSTMPRVSGGANSLGVRSPGSSVTAQSPVKGMFSQGVGPQRMQSQVQEWGHRGEFQERRNEGKKEKGCLACCVVM